MNWKIIIGVLLILGALKETLSIIGDYHSGKLDFYPVGAEIGCVIVVALGCYLIYKGRNTKKQL